MSLLNEIKEMLMLGDAQSVEEKVQQALDNGISPIIIMEEALIAGMDVIGQKFKAGDMYVPEVLIAARAMHKGLDVIKPLVADSQESNKGTILIGTVKGDLHDIGKNLVSMMLEGAGFQVIDLGMDVPSEKFLEAVKQYKPSVVGLSALLTSTMMEMKNTVAALKGNNVKVIIGGAPVTQKFADEIGADGYAADGTGAVELVRQLLE